MDTMDIFVIDVIEVLVNVIHSGRSPDNFSIMDMRNFLKIHSNPKIG